MLFFAVAGILFLAGMEVDLFIPSYPELQAQFGLTPFMVQFCLSLNFVSYCIGSLYAGTLGDRYGMGHVIQYSLLIFILGSLFCVFAPNFPMILVGRVLQGFGIAGPASLSYVVIANKYPPERQAAILGTLNGFITTAMAAAPVIGSYVTQYFGWRGNFAILLGMGIFSSVLCWFCMPKDDEHNKDAHLSLKAYKPLLRTKALWHYMGVVVVLCCAYWIFIAMGPILYIEGLGVPLKEFGYYQGAIAGSFAIVSFLSPKLLTKFGYPKCYRYGMSMMIVMAVLIGLTGVFLPDHPLLITVLMSIFALPMVFPINILYPESLQLVPGASGKIGAMGNVMRLVGTAIGIQFVSYIYEGTFIHIALVILALSIVGFVMGRKLPYWNRKEHTKAVVAPSMH